ncbi:MAG: hydroxyisourate hydrolase [Candidatus Marinimicrobia bacterium]|nr:hydroxyisourate hydrolase [Candidatus Neomarinimicrobiota bacterium]
MPSPLTTHVLDTAAGRPAAGIAIQLARLDDAEQWQPLAESTTDADGRSASLLAGQSTLAPGTYRLTFQVAAYFQARQVDSLFTAIPVVFTIRSPQEHVHVPLLLSPFGYTTYRGS